MNHYLLGPHGTAVTHQLAGELASSLLTQDDLRRPIEPGLDVGVNALVLVAAGAKVDNLQETEGDRHFSLHEESKKDDSFPGRGFYSLTRLAKITNPTSRLSRCVQGPGHVGTSSDTNELIAASTRLAVHTTTTRLLDAALG